MIYSIVDDKLNKISINDISSDNITVAYLTQEELKSSFDILGFSPSTLNDCKYDKGYFFSGLEIYDDYSFGLIKITDVVGPEEQIGVIAMYIKRNLFVMAPIYYIDDKFLSIFENGLRKFKANLTLEKIIFAILSELLSSGDAVIEYALEELRKLEVPLIKNRVYKDTDINIFSLKNKLIQQKRYYDQLYNFAKTLMIDCNNIFGEGELKYLSLYTNEVLKLSETMGFLCENAIHLREVYEDNINNNMNKTMKVLTVLSAVFLPLTLLVGWYGMNFNIPETSWLYGYPYVIGLSIIITTICLFIFKKKNYF